MRQRSHARANAALRQCSRLFPRISTTEPFLLYSQYDQSAAELMLVENFH
jgi:hypothetical protein